jgi:hypothetical protein
MQISRTKASLFPIHRACSALSVLPFMSKLYRVERLVTVLRTPRDDGHLSTCFLFPFIARVDSQVPCECCTKGHLYARPIHIKYTNERKDITLTEA